MLKNKKLKALITTTLVTTFLTGMSVTAFASEKLDYVALGDSLAAGGTTTSNNEYIIGDSYVDYIADKLGQEKALGNLKNYGVSGYTTDDVLNDIKRNDQKAHIKNAEVITLDVGANDLLQYIINTATNPPVINTNPDMNQIISALSVVNYNIISIINEIKAINPDAKIYIMGYYNAFPYAPTEAQDKQLVPLIRSLNDRIRYAASTCGATYVDTMTAMNNNLKEYLSNPYDIHPNVSGYETLANEFWKAIDVDF